MTARTPVLLRPSFSTEVLFSKTAKQTRTLEAWEDRIFKVVMFDLETNAYESSELVFGIRSGGSLGAHFKNKRITVRF